LKVRAHVAARSTLGNPALAAGLESVMRCTAAFIVLFMLLVGPLSGALAQNVEDAAHKELREFREKLVKAILADDVTTQTQLSHPDVVTMWQDGRVVRGHDGLKAFLDELGKGSDRGFLGYAQEPTPLAPSMVIDDRFAFAHGTSVAKYQLYGLRFDLTNYWTASMLKDNGQWRLLGYHVSGNIAENPLLSAAKRSAYVTGAIAGVIGLLVGVLIGRRGRSKALPVTVTSGPA